MSYEAVTTPGMPLTPLSPDEQDEPLCNYLTTPVGMDAANSNFSFKHENQADLPDRPHSSLAEPLPQSPDRHSNASDQQEDDTDSEVTCKTRDISQTFTLCWDNIGPDLPGF